MPDVDGTDLSILLLSLTVTVLDGIAQAGATPAIRDIYILEFKTGERVGFWSTCRVTGNACTQVMNESLRSPSGALHNLLLARYFLLASAILFALVTLAAATYVFRKRDLSGSPTFLRFFKPVSVLALLAQGAVGLTVSTLIGAMQDGSFGATGVVKHAGPNTLEILLWVAFGAVLVTIVVTLRFSGLVGR